MEGVGAVVKPNGIWTSRDSYICTSNPITLLNKYPALMNMSLAMGALIGYSDGPCAADLINFNGGAGVGAHIQTQAY